MKFIKKPITVEAIRWDGTAEGKMAVREFVHADKPLGLDGNVIAVLTNHGLADCNPGDWIICSPAGEYYPCSDAVMQATYDAVPEPQEAELVDWSPTPITPEMVAARDNLVALSQRIAAAGSQLDTVKEMLDARVGVEVDVPVDPDAAHDEEETTGEHKPMNVVTGDSFDRE